MDAQRAVGQILSAGGAGRAPEQALRYFQCACRILALAVCMGCILLGLSVQLQMLHVIRVGAHWCSEPTLLLWCCRRAADGGDADAMAALGHMYANGRGVKASNGTALKW